MLSSAPFRPRSRAEQRRHVGDFTDVRITGLLFVIVQLAFVVVAFTANPTVAMGRHGLNLNASSSGSELLPARVGSPAFPLRTQSRWIVDANGKRVKFACVNWSGAAQKDFVVGGGDHQSFDEIAKTIKTWGFNCVRLPWSLQLVEENPVVNPARLSKNPNLVGKTALEVLDSVISTMGEQGLMVILDNHMSRADWCCSDTDGQGLWYTDHYSADDWVRDWVFMATRYKSFPHVVAAELRNEPRCATVHGKYLCATWASGNPATDWNTAAETCGAAVLKANPDILIAVQGISYSTNLKGVYSNPIKLPIPNRLVMVAHEYSWSQPQMPSAAALSEYLGDMWGYIVTQGKPYTAPVWVSEFGDWSDGRDFGPNSWFHYFSQYLTGADFDWGYWRVDGTESNGTGRTFGAPCGFGLLNPSWNGPSHNGTMLDALKPLVPATQGPSLTTN